MRRNKSRFQTVFLTLKSSLRFVTIDMRYRAVVHGLYLILTTIRDVVKAKSSCLGRSTESIAKNFHVTGIRVIVNFLIGETELRENSRRRRARIGAEKCIDTIYEWDLPTLVPTLWTP